VDRRTTWGEDRVYFYSETDRLERIPAHWTDVVVADPRVVLAGGRSHFRVEDLLRLADLLDDLLSTADE
jgi:hypothetical protein